MGACEQDLKALDHTLEMLKNGTMDYKQSNAVVAVISTKTKVRNQMLNVKALEMKHGRTYKKWADETRMIGGTIDIDTAVQDETIQCPTQEKIITRMECRQFSEATGNLSKCQDCPNFKITRRLLPPLEGVGLVK